MRFDQLAQMSGGELHNPTMLARMFGGVSIDSRTLRPGELFVAIRGEHHDGHKFIPNAIANGAAGILSESGNFEVENLPADLPVVVVKNGHEGLMLLAENYRVSLDTKMIGISGSNGKTTTKEWTYQLIQAVEPRSYRSAGNWNNLYGMPLAIFAMPVNTRIAVMEMGISRFGEMTRLTRIVQPSVMMIINVGPSHLEYLGSETGVARAKLEMFSVAPDNTPALVNGDDETLMAEARKIRGDLITFGLDKPADFTVDRVMIEDDRMTVVIEGHEFNLNYTGRHHVYNLLAAYAASRIAGISFDGIDTKSIRLASESMRGEKIVRDRIHFTVDCYNANPESVRSALNNFAQAHVSGRKVAILGDMLELGVNAPAYHRTAGYQAANAGIDLLVTVGPLSEQIAAGALKADFDAKNIIRYADADTAAEEIRSILREGDTVLLKASRGVGLERLLARFVTEGSVN